MRNDSKNSRGVTRRQFIKIAPIGVAGALALTVLSKRILGSIFHRQKESIRLPENSIFTPDRDRYTKT